MKRPGLRMEDVDGSGPKGVLQPVQLLHAQHQPDILQETIHHHRLPDSSLDTGEYMYGGERPLPLPKSNVILNGEDPFFYSLFPRLYLFSNNAALSMNNYVCSSVSPPIVT